MDKQTTEREVYRQKLFDYLWWIAGVSRKSRLAWTYVDSPDEIQHANEV